MSISPAQAIINTRNSVEMNADIGFLIGTPSESRRRLNQFDSSHDNNGNTNSSSNRNNLNRKRKSVFGFGTPKLGIEECGNSTEEELQLNDEDFKDNNSTNPLVDHSVSSKELAGGILPKQSTQTLMLPLDESDQQPFCFSVSPVSAKGAASLSQLSMYAAITGGPQATASPANAVAV